MTGSLYFAGTLYWIPHTLTTYGDQAGPVAVVVTILLIAYLALFPGAFAATLVVLRRAFGIRALLIAPAVWVTSELGRMYFLSGFPWELLGYSQTHVLPVAQLASLAGVHGVSAFVVLVNAAAVLAVRLDGVGRRHIVLGTVTCVALVVAWGSWRIQQSDLNRAGEPVRVALLQGNVPQDQKRDLGMDGRIVQRYLAMTRDAAARGARVIIWPESAVPFYFEGHTAGRELIRGVAKETGAYLLFGGEQFESGAPARFYNAAFLVTPAGETGPVYRKIHLVPFGEYVPARRLLFFASPLVEVVSSFSPGREAVVLPIGEHSASTAICYEVIYPGLIDRFVDAGSELITTITNDAWFGDSSAPAQHFQQAAMRAIEQGRFLVRAANTGISGVVDPLGRVTARSRLFEQASIVADVRWIAGRTVYGRVGDVFAWACVALTLVGLAATRRQGTRASGRTPAQNVRRSVWH